MMTFTTLDLVPWMNRRGFTSDHERRDGQFNAWGNSFPQEEATFDSVMEIGGIPFMLRQFAGVDHVESLGQRIEFGPGPTTHTVALLCCGEMGDRDLEVVAVGAGMELEVLHFHAPGWLVEPSERGHAMARIFTHLHYPGDYELASLCPALFGVCSPLPTPRELVALELDMNPFFHIFAATLCHHARCRP